MDGPGFHVEIEVLEAAATGITRSVADQRSLELAELDLASSAYGHVGVHSAMAKFGDQWNEGLGILLDDAQAIGDILGRAAKAYREADTASAGRLTTDPAGQVVDD